MLLDAASSIHSSARSLSSLLGGHKVIAFDTETVGVNPKKRTETPWSENARIIIASAATEEHTIILHPEDLKDFSRLVRGKTLVGHNLFCYDFPIAHHMGIDFSACSVIDTLGLARLVHAGSDKKLGLKALAADIGIEMEDFQDVFRVPSIRKDGTPGRLTEAKLEDVIRHGHPLRPKLLEYAGLDASANLAVFHDFREKYPKELAFYQKTWGRVYEICYDISKKGVAVSQERLDAAMAKLTEDEKLTRRKFNDWVVSTGNLAISFRSPQQMQQFLYGKAAYVGKGKNRYFVNGLGLRVSPVCSKGPTKPGKQPTDRAAIDWLIENNPEHAIGLGYILELRTIESSKKYLTKLPLFADSNGRVHGLMAPSTSTGRMAVSKPELQQMPKDGAKDPYGIRNCIVAKPGHKLIALDYSQLEVRVLGHITSKLFGDRSFIESILSEDPHSANALRVFSAIDPSRFRGLKAEDIKSHPDPQVRDSRQAIKMVTYGIAYGSSEYSLGSKLVGPDGKPIGAQAAKRIIDGFFEIYPALAQYGEWVKEYARKHGKTPTLLGRHRLFPFANAKNRGLRGMSERAALNAPIQGTAADIVCMAMIKLADAGANMVLQVHDEIVFEERDDDMLVEKVKKYKHIMETCLGGHDFHCPLAVDGGIGDSWGEAK